MKKLDPNDTKPPVYIHFHVTQDMLRRIENLEKRFKKSNQYWKRAPLARHLIDLGLQCYEKNK